MRICLLFVVKLFQELTRRAVQIRIVVDDALEFAVAHDALARVSLILITLNSHLLIIWIPVVRLSSLQVFDLLSVVVVLTLTLTLSEGCFLSDHGLRFRSNDYIL